MKLGFTAIVLSLVLLGCQSNQGVQAARDNNVGLNDAEKNFIADVEKANIKERSLGRIVLAKSQNKDVRDYAQMLVDDHTKALQDLVDLMEKKGISERNGLPEVKHEAESKLMGLSGPAFDHKFADHMVADHDQEISKFRQEARMADDKDLKDYVLKMIPILEKHLQKAQELDGKLRQP